MIDDIQLTPKAQSILKLVENVALENKSDTIGRNHWLKALLSDNAGLLMRMAVRFDPKDVGQNVNNALIASDPGALLSIDRVLLKAHSRAKALGKSKVGIRDIAAAVLVTCGYDLQDPSDPIKKQKAGFSKTEKRIAELVDAVSPTPEESIPDQDDRELEQSEKEKDPAQAQPKKDLFIISTPEILRRFGRDLTQQVVDGALSPIIGREQERQLLVETLCRRTKRNPMLVGPAGVGKTAIVEGFAEMIVGGQVPDVLKGHRVIAIQPSAIVAGARFTGELEKRMQAVIEAASQDGIILFIDEFHSAVGTGGMAGTSDMASVLKPALARGELACIAATTNSEYRRFVEPDGALERRFQPIRVNELSPDATLAILHTLEKTLTEDYQIGIDPGVTERIIEFGKKYMHNRHFPDKAVDLLEQCYAHALATGLHEITSAVAQSVAQRMVGMPLDLEIRFNKLQKTLQRETPLNEEDISALLNRLQVTMRGLDLRNDRPNAVMLLMGSMQENNRVIGQALSKALFNTPDRVVTIDLSRMTQPEDINLLVGAPPGYVGYSDALPLHEVVQMPWCILRLDHLDRCHPQIRSVLTQAISEGVITDGRGQSIFLSDTIIILSTVLSPAENRAIGFSQEVWENNNDVHTFVSAQFGEALADQIDLFIFQKTQTDSGRRLWIEEVLLEAVTHHYAQQGITLIWDKSILNWLENQIELDLVVTDWSRFLDQTLTPEIIKKLPDMASSRKSTLNLSYDGKISVSVQNSEERDMDHEEN